MNEKIFNQLRTSDLFKGVDKDLLFGIFNRTKTVLKCYKKGCLVMMRGEKIEDLLILVEGQLSAEIHGMNGKNLRIEVLRPPDPVASGIIFTKNIRLPVSLYTEKDSDILHIPQAAVLDICLSSRVFTRNYFREMGEKITFLAEKIRLFQFNTIRQKIAGYLLGLSVAGEPEIIELNYSREVLSELMGVTRPALSREFSILAERGFIEVSGRSVKIKNKQALASLLSED